MLPLAARLGNILYVAQYPRDYDIPLNAWTYLYEHELTISGMILSPNTWHRTADIIERFDLDAFTQVVYDLENIKEAFEAHMSGKYPKVLVRGNAGWDPQ
jgi:(R,R)-butanediol dehydrogenase/meso-butanediol dehydrogenase/diacetyl reductase/L-iditol 2-dehydrogenase